jgi:hypothetical protein
MGEEIGDFDDYLEEQGFEEYTDVLSDYEDVIRERMKTKNVSPKTTLGGALYDAKQDEMTQYEVAVLADTTETSIRSAREAMGLDTGRNLNELMQVVPYAQAPLLDAYFTDTVGEPPEAVAAIIHSEVLGKDEEETAEYFGVTEDEIERASSWLEENQDDEELAFEAVRRHLDEVRQEPEAFKQFLEK